MSQEPNQDKFILSREGALLLGVDRQSFFYYVESRNVRKREINNGGKDHYEYSYNDLLSIKDEIHSKRSTRKKSKPINKGSISEIENRNTLGLTDWCKREDLPYIYAMDCDLYGIEYSVPADKTIHWLEKNQYTIRVLFNSKNRRDIWGCITLLPMNEEAIFDLLRGDMSEQEIKPEHILIYEEGKEYSCYVTSCAIRPEHRKSFNMLFNSIMDYWCDHPNIRIRKLYGFAVGANEDGTEENDGLRMIKKLFFSPRYDIDRNAWELDLTYYNPSPVIQRFQKCLRERKATNA